ncbi:MAG: PepSY domain-containing protein [Acetatifactor sp.]|nr:PepSY domain-containing protein [Acetatifactor sp.]
MKRKTFLCAIGLIAVLFAGCSRQQGQASYIGAETAKQTALEAASLSEQAVSSVNTDMGTRDGADYYQVSFEADGKSYRYDIDALTGKVIRSETLPAADGQSGQAEQIEQAKQVEQTKPQEDDAPDTGGDSQNQPAKTTVPAASDSGSEDYIGEEKARRIALEHAKLEENQVTFVHSLLEFDDGLWEYDVEFYTADYKEYDYEINAYTGEIIDFDYDAESYAPQTESSGAITPEQAKQLAIDKVPGASKSDIREFKTDSDDGIVLYEGEIVYEGIEYEFEIDADSGTFQEWSAEPFDR